MAPDASLRRRVSRFVGGAIGGKHRFYRYRTGNARPMFKQVPCYDSRRISSMVDFTPKAVNFNLKLTDPVFLAGIQNKKERS